MNSLRDFLKNKALEQGFDLSGIAPASGLSELEYFPTWISEGRAGEMSYLSSRNEAGELKRSSLSAVAPWAKSVVVVAMNYNTAEPRSTDPADGTSGWISRYAWTRTDYHDHMLRKLREVEAELCAECERRGQDRPRTWCYVDTGPVIERVLAQHAGIGWTGKNACIINQQIGSYIFLGVMLTSLELTDEFPADFRAADRCGTCTRCLDACPTNAFLGPRRLDASRCISYLTIEKRGSIPEDLRDGIGRHIFGCDICQDVCPWNRRAAVTANPDFAPRTELVNPSLEWISGMNQDEFRQVFRGSPIKRTKLSGMRRNAVIAMGNSGDQRFVPQVEKLASDEDAVVAEHARWALKKLKPLKMENIEEKAVPAPVHKVEA